MTWGQDQDQIYWLFFKEEAWEYDRAVTKLLVTCSLVLHTRSQLIIIINHHHHNDDFITVHSVFPLKCGSSDTCRIYINGMSYKVSDICLPYRWILLTTCNFTHSIKGKSIILRCNRCYRLQPLMTALDMHVCQDVN